jgi:hypothetical protein
LRLPNKLKLIIKKVGNKFKSYEVKNEILCEGHDIIVRMDEEQWTEEKKRLVFRPLHSNDCYKLNQLINVRLERRVMCKIEESQFEKVKSKNMRVKKITTDFWKTYQC